jgi:hypothetical protein
MPAPALYAPPRARTAFEELRVLAIRLTLAAIGVLARIRADRAEQRVEGQPRR